jgi:hypothetical protein
VLSASSAPHRQRCRTHDLHSIFRRAASSANACVNLRVGPIWKHAKASIGLKTLAIAYGKRRPTENRVRWRPLDMRLCLWVAWVTRHRRLSVALPRWLLRLLRARGRPASPNEIRAEFRCVPGDMRDLKFNTVGGPMRWEAITATQSNAPFPFRTSLSV